MQYFVDPKVDDLPEVAMVTAFSDDHFKEGLELVCLFTLFLWIVRNMLQTSFKDFITHMLLLSSLVNGPWKHLFIAVISEALFEKQGESR